jgi:hypothetical protein
MLRCNAIESNTWTVENRAGKNKQHREGTKSEKEREHRGNLHGKGKHSKGEWVVGARLLAQYASTASVLVLRQDRPRRRTPSIARPRYALYVRATPLPTATALCIVGDAAIASSASSATALTSRRKDSSLSADTNERRRDNTVLCVGEYAVTGEEGRDMVDEVEEDRDRARVDGDMVTIRGGEWGMGVLGSVCVDGG